ncbi:MAG: hypothetical protein ACR2PQ_09345, partial [Myxococcota bacterium]
MRLSKEVAACVACFALTWASGCAWFGSDGVPEPAPDSLADRLEELGDTDPGRPRRVLWISLSGLEAGDSTRELPWVGRLAAHGA